MEKFKKLINHQSLTYITILIVAINPIIELDYLLYDSFFSQVGIPRISTLVHFILIPLLIFWTFLQKDKHKKITVIATAIYGVAVLAYFIIHVLYVNRIWIYLYLPPRFDFRPYQELVYVVTLLMPYFLIYQFFLLNIKESLVKKMTLFLSGIISTPILVSNIFMFGQGTYISSIAPRAPFFMWFFAETHQLHGPRYLASKFFFEEGNTIGILLFMLLPIMYYFLARSESTKEKVITSTLIVIQSLAMIILATRVAAFGAVLIPISFLVIYLFCCFIMKNEQFKTYVAVVTILIGVFGTIILPVSPAILHHRQGEVDNQIIIRDRQQLEDAIASWEASDRDYHSRYCPQLVFMFQSYALSRYEFQYIHPNSYIDGGANLLGNVPRIFFNFWYPYEHDAVFWVDVVMFGTPPENRVNNRQIQRIFFDYKLDELDGQPIWLGMGFSTFMNGSIVLEQDFIQQIYTLGIVGSVLLTGPWLYVTFAGIVLILRKFKQLLNMEVLCYGVAIIVALISAYLSGHTIDKFTTSIYMAFIVAILLRRIYSLYKEGKVNDKS